MQKELENIFVPEAVARLAKDKGFNEWCASTNLGGDILPIIKNKSYVFDFDFNPKYSLPTPTHFQLIKWLKDKHDIDVQMELNGKFLVLNQYGNLCYNADDDNEFEINEALTIALNQIKENV